MICYIYFVNKRLVFYTDKSGNNPVDDFINTLSDRAANKVARALAPLHEFGIGTHIKEAKKVVGTPIWEIRILGKDSIRIMYTAALKDIVLLLHGFVKKSQKTPQKDLAVATRRLNDWINRHSQTS